MSLPPFTRDWTLFCVQSGIHYAVLIWIGSDANYIFIYYVQLSFTSWVHVLLLAMLLNPLNYLLFTQ